MTAHAPRRALASGFSCWCVALIVALSASPADLGAQTHPLDPPTWEEHWTVLDVLKDEGRLDRETGFSLVLLNPPDKQAVWNWAEGDPIPRSLLVVTRREGMTSEAVVDVANGRLVSWRDVPGAQAPWLVREFGAGTEAVLENADYLAALERRGVTDTQFLECFAGPPGRFGLDEEEGRRIAHVHCTDDRRVRNEWTRGIEGVLAVVDADTGEVLRIEDEGGVAVPDTDADYDRTALGRARENAHPMEVDQPRGVGYVLDGNEVTWENWRFHVRPDQRVGMIVSVARWVDGDDVRPVLYEGSLSEIFVPYMDPANSWYARNFLDAGEYTQGGLGKPMDPGVDCPDYATFLDMVVVTDSGRPTDVPNAVCIFERVTGDPAWRHRAETLEGRPKRDLVVRSAAVLGNYDYLFDWVFQQDGSIFVRVGATGITEAKPVGPRNATMASVGGDGEVRRGGDEGSGPSDVGSAFRAPAADNGASVEGWNAEAADAYGRFVDDHIVAVNHDHYFSFRLDLDVDGMNNVVRRDGLRAVELPEGHPRRSVWVLDGAPLRTESEAKLNVNLKRPALWRVASPARANEQAYPTSYQIKPGAVVETLLAENDWPRMRAGFIDHHLWVTPYRPEERYAAGMYPTLSAPGQGLPEWTAADRAIENTDVVVWYTTGMHHVVRAEDWPVMPVAWSTFELRPFDFFDRNPALNAPRKP